MISVVVVKGYAIFTMYSQGNLDVWGPESKPQIFSLNLAMPSTAAQSQSYNYLASCLGFFSKFDKIFSVVSTIQSMNDSSLW